MNLQSSILKKKEQRLLFILLADAETSFKSKTEMHALISKYRNRRWFQQSMCSTLDELKYQYHHLAKDLDLLEQAIHEYKTLLYNHMHAVEAMHEQMTPYKGIDINNLELSQSQLF